LAGGKNALRGIYGTKHPPEIFTGRRRNKQRIWRKTTQYSFMTNSFPIMLNQLNVTFFHFFFEADIYSMSM
jgi:hypothetical protein